MFNKEQRQKIMKRFARADVEKMQGKLGERARNLKGKQSGFTLLELLVVVAILAAIAGTATIALQDTDARASAAAHVAMMDELNKGIRTYRVLNKNQLPNNFDSLIEVDSAALDNPAVLSIAAIDDVQPLALPAGVAARMSEIGMTSLQYVAKDQDPDDDGTCADIEGLIGSRGNAVVAGNIFLTQGGNGCGVAHDLFNETTEALNGTPTAAFWTGGQERLIGQPATGTVDHDLDSTTPEVAVVELATDPAGATNFLTATGTAFLAVGLGPASTLFNANDLGGMTSVPVYRHVSATQYNRFIAMFDVGDFDGTGGINPADQVSLAAIVDGAGDTKEEELGEWDGTRNTI